MAGSALGGAGAAIAGTLPGQGKMRNGVFDAPNIAPQTMAPSAVGFAQGGQQIGNQIVPAGHEIKPSGGVGPMEPLAQLPEPVGGAKSISSGKGGTSNVTPQPTPPNPQPGSYAPLATQGNFDVNQASAGALQQAMQGTQQAMNYQPQSVQPTGYQAQTAQATGYRPSAMQSQGYQATGPQATGFQAAGVGSTGYGASTIGQSPTVSAQNVQAGQLAGSNLSAYTNPYEDQVVQQTLTDLKGAQEKELNQMGAQASAAGAFGGSRQGIAEAETRKGYADKAAQAVSGLRQAGFTQAQQMAQQDISTAQQAALANQQANLQAGTTSAGFGQQSNLANQAARNAAAQFGAGAANQAGMQQSAQQQAAAQFGAGAQNVASQQAAAAQTAASQFGAGAANQAAATNMAAQNAAAQFGAGAQNQMALSNMGALNQAGQYNAGNAMMAQQLNQSAGLQGNQARLGAAGQLGQLGNQAFNTGQAIQSNQLQQGLMQQGLQQALIDAARGQYAGYTGAPNAALSAPLAALGVTPVPQSTTTSSQPGLFDYLSLGIGMSDVRLKKNIVPAGELGGVKFYEWDWNDEGKRIANPDQPTFGVIADELQETHPHLVQRGKDGYLRVNYTGLTKELEAA